ncbi:MAG TPA: hypothetical protein DCO77_08155 [Nitrospiraceae bacterium]|nr:hypothetical protein [Nitrospiraceae bacterium]
MKRYLSKMSLPIPPRILDRLVPEKFFGELNIASKLVFGYMTLVALTIIVVGYALIGLLWLNSLNKSIVTVDIPTQEASGRMLDALDAQDRYEKKYLILRSKAMRLLFAKRNEEFRTWLTQLKNLRADESVPIATIEALHNQYNDLFLKEIGLVRKGRSARARRISRGELRAIMDELIETLNAVSAAAKTAQEKKMKRIRGIGGTTFMGTTVLWLVTIVIGALAGLIVTHHIVSSIHKLKVATEHIADGNFDYDPKIKTEDEIGTLSESFLAMGRRLKKLEEMYLDASPLTRLPGGIAIENVLKKRIDSDQPIAFCVLDLDNFKAFNDQYGYAHGSEVIKETGRIIESVVKTTGQPEDFIGHVGGDDFVVITTPAFMAPVCSEIITQFDKSIPRFYAEKDRKNGYIHGKTRQGVEIQFPIMTISIAIVTNERRELSDPLEASEVAAELKDYAKTVPKSIYVVDKRRRA